MPLKNLFIIIASLLCLSGYAQSVKKATRCYNLAMKNWSERKQSMACIKMERAIQYDATNPDYYTILGKWYFDRHMFPQAAATYRNGYYRFNNKGKRLYATPFTRSLIYSGMPDSALFILYVNRGNIVGKEYKVLSDQAAFVKQAMASATYIYPLNLGIRINTRYAEMFPLISHDMQTLYFTRRINKLDQDIMIAHADSCGGWFSADNAGPSINSPNEELATNVSTDGHYLFFTRCEIKSDNGWEGGGCDLYMSYRTKIDTDWYFPEPFGATINTPAYEGMPSLSPDNRALYFVSDRPGGYGGTDIWISHFEDGLWQLPLNAGPQINTAGNEAAPFIAADNSTLYFSSDGHPGFGGYDLFVASRKNDTTWEQPRNLGFPINSANDEVSQCITLNGEQIFFASDRNNKTGNYDIYQTELPAYLRPHPVCFVQGFVYDSISSERLNEAFLYVENLRTHDTIYRFQSNRGDGSFIMLLEKGNKYAIYTKRFAYNWAFDTIKVNKSDQSDSINHNICLLASDYLAPIHDSLLATIHFDVNKVDLTPEDKSTIREALTPWLLEKRYVLHVNGYTDNTGTPMINEELSTKRAKQVLQEILSIGIDEMMVEAHGWGEAKMIAPNDNEINQRKNRRVEITLSR